MLFKKCDSPKSLLDFLIHIMPDLKDTPFILLDLRRPSVNNKAAKTLFQIWKDESNIAGEFCLKRPDTLSKEEIDLLQREGLAKSKEDKIEITKKGIEVIRTMILGDDKSAFEDDGKIIDYHKACANLKPPRRIKRAKVASKEETNWWRRIKDAQ